MVGVLVLVVYVCICSVLYNQTVTSWGAVSRMVPYLLCILQAHYHSVESVAGATDYSFGHQGSPSPPSPPVSLLPAVVPPQGLQLLKSTENSLLVSWEPSSEVDHYLLSYYPLEKEHATKQVRVPKEQHTYDITGLLPGTKYIVTLRNVKKDISSSPQHLLATTGEEQPDHQLCQDRLHFKCFPCFPHKHCSLNCLNLES